jgi:alkylhydroperoxidase family enzyme
VHRVLREPRLILAWWLLLVSAPLYSAQAEQPAPQAIVLNDAEAWKRLPQAEKGAHKPLPVWARALVESLPQTTAAMLELDYEQRTAGPLTPQLRSRIRWLVARENQCAFGEACALADLVRAGGDPRALQAQPTISDRLPKPEQSILNFAQKLTRAAYSVTDEEVAQLVAWYGNQQVVGVVLMVAYANFLDRLVLALNLPPTEGPLEPLDVRFKRPFPDVGRTAPSRPEPPKTARPVKSLTADRAWLALDFDQLQKQIAAQRARQPRVPLPASQASAVQWGLACRTYQPRLADSWATCQRAFSIETDQDRIFEASLFWVVTHTQRSFY